MKHEKSQKVSDEESLLRGKWRTILAVVPKRSYEKKERLDDLIGGVVGAKKV